MNTSLWIFDILIMSLCGIAISASASETPQPEELLTRYYRDTGADLVTGQAVVVIHTYQPTLSPTKFQPTGVDPKEDEKRTKIYHQYLADVFNVRLASEGPEHRWYLVKLHYSGAKKRKDLARLDQSEYERALSGKLPIESLPVERYFDDGYKMTSMHVEGQMQSDPQGMISKQRLGLPDIQHFGRAVCDPEAAEFMIKHLKSDQFVIYGASESDGYHVVATAGKPPMTQIEAVFDSDNGYRVKLVRGTLYYALFEENLFEDYITTASGDYIPTKVVRRKFAPVSEVVSDAKTGMPRAQPVLSFEETTTVLSVDFNVDIPDSTFTAAFPVGTTVVDMTSTAIKTYKAGSEPQKSSSPPKQLDSTIALATGSRARDRHRLASLLSGAAIVLAVVFVVRRARGRRQRFS